MRRIARLGSNLLVFAALVASRQDAELRADLKALAAGGAFVDAALKRIDALPIQRLPELHALAAAESAEVREAARRSLPPSTWTFSTEKTIGDGRAAMAKLLADFAEPKRGQRNPNVLAAKQLVYRSNPSIVPEVLRIFREQDGSLQEMPARLLAIFGTEDLTPALCEALSSDENRSRYALDALFSLADSRAEKALLELLRKKTDEMSRVVEALSLIGGDESRDEFRKLMADPAQPPYMRNALIEARLRLRDPQLPRDLLSMTSRKIGDSRLLGQALVRMGDASVLPDLVKLVEDPNESAHDQIAALRAIGILGNRAHTALAVKCLLDGRIAGGAVDALVEIGDPAASVPLAEAMKNSVMGEGYARALLMLPMGDIGDRILAILNDPEGHRMTINHAILIAGRIDNPGIRARLLAMLMDPGHHWYDDFEVARALAPKLTAKDLRRLSRSSSPDAPREKGDTASARLALRGALGHKESRMQFVAGLVNFHGSLRYRDSNGMGAVHPLLKYPGPLEELIPDVQAVFKAHPTWSAGAQFLAKFGRLDGLELLKSEAASKKLYWLGVLPELPASVVWKLNSEDWMKEASDGDLARLGREMPDSAAAPLAESILLEAAEAHSKSGDLRAHPRPGTRNGAGGNSLDQGAGTSIGLFAAKTDPRFENLYRWQIRVRTNYDSPGFSVWESALALARLRAADMKGTYLRMLRSSSALRRALGCRCLAILGDRAATTAIAGLLDDHERIEEVPTRYDLVPLDVRPPSPRVCDEAADAIEKLSGEKFPEDRAPRISAMKTWLEKAGKK